MASVDDLDRLDPRRFDAEELVDRLNAYDELSDAEQVEELCSWEYSGMSDAEHILSGLLPEVHNGTAVVRDLSGELMLLWTDSQANDTWQLGPLYGDHLLSGETVEERIEYVEGDLGDVNPELVERIVADLPCAPGPVMSY